MTQYATDLQMYVGLKEIEKATSEVTKYIEDLKRGGQFDENSIEVTISSDLHSILHDVKSFGKIGSTEQPICTICDDDRISKTAVTWCTECEVFFCGKCEKPHRKSRLSKDHKTMSAEDYHQLPTFIVEISSQCREHQEKFERYCPFHACLCCVQYITDKHQKCQDIKPSSVILNQAKSSASVPLFEKDLKNL
ncbi:uncharacterized protein [Mytilus edulis]|uniref:uncharacterized protein n=1 Tax=Mytilus edulis TaxID=6550 RepID=UPI0039EE1ED2